mgnify:CR=1 FL=1
MLTEDDEKEDIVVFVPKGRNAESYKDIAKEEIDSLTQNAEELRVVYKEYSGREQFYFSIRTEKRLLTDCQEQQIRLLFIRQMRLLL